MDKIAIISDIHGNLEALKAVFNDVDKRGIKEVYCLGDIIAKGAHPKECLALIKERCKVIIRGNCDRYFSSEQDLSQKSSEEAKRYLWNHRSLSKEEREYLLSLPFSHEFYMSGNLVRIFHATPNWDNGLVLSQSSPTDKYTLFLPSDNTVSDKVADVCVYGHIHYQYLEKIYNRVIINAGSVGNSLDTVRNDAKDADDKFTSCAFYLVLEGALDAKELGSLSYQFIRVPYDVEKELASNNRNIELESYTYELKNGKYRNMDKINKTFNSIGIDPDNL